MSIRARLKGPGEIFNNKKEKVGITKRVVPMKRAYETEIEESFLKEADILLGGIIHTFWCGLDRN